MACFIVPAAEAIVTTIIDKVATKKQKTSENIQNTTTHVKDKKKNPFLLKLKWLSNLLWGGSILLAFEHVWHGEVTPWFPFLTGATDAKSMFFEMATSGVAMAVLVTLVWVGMVIISFKREKKAISTVPVKKSEVL